MVQSNIPRGDDQALLASLAGFHGTSGYHRYIVNTLLTDGAKYLAEKAACFWLLDIVAGVQTKSFRERADGLQKWTIALQPDDSAEVICAARGVELYRQRIADTDFPLGRDEPFSLYVGPYGDMVGSVICLGGEL